MNWVMEFEEGSREQNVRCWGNRNDPLIMSILGEPREHETNNGENND